MAKKVGRAEVRNGSTHRTDLLSRRSISSVNRSRIFHILFCTCGYDRLSKICVRSWRRRGTMAEKVVRLRIKTATHKSNRSLPR